MQYWLRLRLLGPWTSLLEMSARVPADEVFTRPVLIPDDIREVMYALCLEVVSTHPLEGELHLALLLHWRVQAYLVGYLDPDSRRSIAGGCWGSGSMVGPSGLHHEPGTASPGQTSGSG